jgi:4-hydroxy-tetrahydrodipicolinate synthase
MKDEKETDRLIQGVYTALVTPFTETGEIDEPLFVRLLAFQEAAGVNGVVVCGTNGEGPSLSVHERVRLYELACQHRGKLQIIAGTASSSLSESLYLIKKAVKAGCNALMISPPFYFKSPSIEGLEAFYRPLLDSCTLPVILYHIPRMTQVPIEPALVERLLNHPNLFGIKDSECAPPRMPAYLSFIPRLKLFVGVEKQFASALKQGASGTICGLANGFPEPLVHVWQAFRTGGDLQAAQSLVTKIFTGVKTVPAVLDSKYMLHLRGFPLSPVRPPLVELDQEQKETLQTFYDGLQI